VSNASDLLIYLFICQQAVAVAAAAAEERGGRDLSKAVRSLPTCTFAIGALSLSTADLTVARLRHHARARRSRRTDAANHAKKTHTAET
jgi:hypothetical protein